MQASHASAARLMCWSGLTSLASIVAAYQTGILEIMHRACCKTLPFGPKGQGSCS